MINGITPNTANRKLSIFYTNDLHGNTDNLGGLYSASKSFDKKVQQEKCDSIKLTAGDNYAGEDLKKNDFVLSMFSQMGIKYSAVGNHEFDVTSKGFADNVKRHNMEYISSNLNIENTNDLKPLIKEAKIEEINGEKYGIVGFTTGELKTAASSLDAIKGVNVEEGNNAIIQLQKQVDSLKAQGVNKIILLSHNGFEADKELAKKMSGIDIIISGHSHDIVQGARKEDNIIQDKEGHPTVIVQTGENGRNYGLLDVEFDENGILKKIDNNVYKTQEIQSPVVDYIKDSTMGKSPVIANIKSIDPFPLNKRMSPCAWSNLICDSIKDAMGVDIAFMNSANTRKVPTTGKLTQRDVSDTSPFKNTLLKTTMTEKEIIEAIKFGAKSMTTEGGIPGLVQVSGMEYKVDKQGNLKEAYFKDKNGNKTPMNIQNPSDSKTYSVCYDSFMADGREYPPFDIKKRRFEIQQTELLKDQVAIQYISKMPDNIKQNLEIKDDGRLQIV